MGGQLRDNLEGEGVGVELLELIEISAGRYKQCFFFSIPSIKPNLVGTWCQLDPFLPGRVRFLHQTTELCAAEWSTRARQLYIKPFVHYQHSRVFPVYASRGDGDDVWRATVALNNLAALSQNKLTVQWMQRDVQIILKWIFFFFGGGGVFVRSIFTIRFFFLSLSGREKNPRPDGGSERVKTGAPLW